MLKKYLAANKNSEMHRQAMTEGCEHTTLAMAQRTVLWPCSWVPTTNHCIEGNLCLRLWLLLSPHRRSMLRISKHALKSLLQRHDLQAISTNQFENIGHHWYKLDCIWNTPSTMACSAKSQKPYNRRHTATLTLQNPPTANPRQAQYTFHSGHLSLGFGEHNWSLPSACVERNIIAQTRHQWKLYGFTKYLQASTTHLHCPSYYA